MKQLYAVGTLDRTSQKNQLSGFASSTGVRPDDLRAALSTANYAPPPAGGDRPLPVRLALLNAGPVGRVLTHVTPNGGTYFAHTLLDVPPTADAQLAVQTWGSPVWQRHQPDTAAPLPEMSFLPVADVLDDAALQNWLADPIRREMLEFVLNALLTTPPTTRIVLAAAAEDVAAVVYAATRALPPALVEDFTFSTYEPDPLACPARLIGHDTGSPDWELPTACFADGCVGFNPATGRRSDGVGSSPFAAFAAATLADGKTGPLDELKATWQRTGLRDVRAFDLLVRVVQGNEVPTRAEAAEVLRHPPLAELLAARSEARAQLLRWALEDRTFATESFTKVVQALRLKPDLLAGLARTVRDEGLAALTAGDRARAETALEVVLPTTAPAKAHAVWGELIEALADPDQVPWEVRGYLLPRFVRYKQQHGVAGVDAALARWFDVPAERLEELLGFDVPRVYQVAAARTCLRRDGEPSQPLVRTLAGHPDLVLALLRPESESDPERSAALFDRLLAEAPAHPWFESLLGTAGSFPAALMNRFFESALAAGKIDADRVVRTHGPRMLELFTGQSGLDRLGTQFLADPPADLLRNDGVLDFLGRLRDEPKVGEELKSRIAAVLAVRAYLKAPAFTAEAMAPTAAALSRTPPVVPAGTRADLFTAVSNALVKEADSPALQADLEAVLLHFGSVLANDPTDLFENLLRDLRGRVDLARRPNLVATLLAVALGAANSPELKLDGLDGHAFALASDAGKLGGNRLLNRIDRHTAEWPKPARAQWSFLLAAVRPPGWKRLVRDSGFFLGGAAVVIVAVWAARLLS